MTTPEPNEAPRGQHPAVGPNGLPQPQHAPVPHPQYAPVPQPVQTQPPMYPAQPGAPYGHPGYPVRRPTGTLSWALGFLIFLTIPFLSGIVSGAAMAIAYNASAKHGGTARENARSAANWGLTYVALSIVLAVTHFIVLAALSGTSASRGFFPIGIPIVVYFAVSILHVVLIIVGTVRASGGKVMRVPFAIPYIRA